MRTEDVFPYPDGEPHPLSRVLTFDLCMYVSEVLTDDERQSLSMFLGPVTKFVEVRGQVALPQMFAEK